MKAALMALVLLPLTVANAGAVALPSTGVVTDGVGVNIHVWQDETQRDRIQAAGCKWIRDDLRWDAIESTPGVYDWNSASWDPYDTLVSDGAARGIHMLYTLGGIPTGAISPYGVTDLTSATWRQAFTNYAAAAAAHFAGTGAIFELWNEPDNWGITASEYMTLANQVIPAMRTANPNCTIVGPACWGGNSSFQTTCYQNGLLNLVDAVSVHPYQTGNPENVVSMYTEIRSLMQTYGHKTPPIVSSEWGYSSVQGTPGQDFVSTPQLQGDYMARAFLVNFSQGIPLSSWYEWGDYDPTTPPTDYEGGFAIGDRINNVSTPAYNELKLLTASLKGETFTQQLSDGHTSDWLLVFTAPNGQKTLAAWTTRSGGRTVSVSGWGTLQLTSTPFYVNPTLLPGDANLDGRVDVLDLAILAANYRKQVTGGWMQADFNHDGVVDVEDLALLAANYRHSLASDIVPAYDGLDAATIELLSLAGVTVVPESSTLVMLAAALIGALANARRKRR